MKVLGLDQSLNHTGYCYDDEADGVITGRIEPKSLKGVPRLAFNRRSLIALLEHVQPTLVVMEEYAMGVKGNGRTFHMGEWGGIVKVECWIRGIDVMIVGIKTMKELVTGYGAADKAQVIEAIRSRFGYTINDDNEADACGLMQVGKARRYRVGPPRFKVAVQRMQKGIEFVPGGIKQR